MNAFRQADGTVFIHRTGLGEDGEIGDGYDEATEDKACEWLPWTVDEERVR